MAEKRMFTMKICDSDPFLEMPLSAQALYFHLNMRADDDGFVNNPKRIMRMINASEDDLKILLTKRFVLPFPESCIIVIKHWRMHNTIQSDRYKPTQYQEELGRLLMKPNKSYTDRAEPLPAEQCFQSVSNMETKCIQDGNGMETKCFQPVSKLETDCIQTGNNLYPNCIQPVSKMDTQIRLDKIRLDKCSIDRRIEGEEEKPSVLPADESDAFADYADYQAQYTHALYTIKDLHIASDLRLKAISQGIIDANGKPI